MRKNFVFVFAVFVLSLIVLFGCTQTKAPPGEQLPREEGEAAGAQTTNLQKIEAELYPDGNFAEVEVTKLDGTTEEFTLQTADGNEVVRQLAEKYNTDTNSITNILEIETEEGEEEAEEPSEQEEQAPKQEPQGGEENIVEIDSSGFSPKTLTINAGETVSFVNTDSALHWPASDVHPTHKAYPGSGISKCGSAEEKNIFDACKGLEEGESFTFTFNEKGSWDYHDHLSPGKTGMIVVE